MNSFNAFYSIAVLFLTLLCFSEGSYAMAEKNDGGPEIVDVRRIWDKAPHNAFTDLIRFNDQWYCTFREGETHVSTDGTDNGKIRIIRSPNGKEWTSVALLRWEGGDLRDGKLSITAGGKLMLNGSVAFYPRCDEQPRRSLTWLSADGRKFSGPYECETGIDTWRWSVSWQGQYGYSIGYSGKDTAGCLYRTKDGKKWEVVKDDLFPHGESKYYNESSLFFMEGGKAYCLLRGDPHEALLGTAEAPYKDWQWKNLGMRVGGPKLKQLPDGRLIAAVRLYEPRRTSLCWIDPGEETITEFMTLPSGGDTSYAGMIWYNDILWVSYYSSHEEKTSIYLARVQL